MWGGFAWTPAQGGAAPRALTQEGGGSVKGLLGRATRCPVCGGKACGILKRAGVLPIDRKINCRCCGCGCRTPMWVYLVMLAAGALCGFAAYGFDYSRLPIFYWELSSDFLLFFLYGYALSGAAMAWLVPLRPCPEKMRALPPQVRIGRSVPYAAGDVYHAACNALRRADGYEVLERLPERLQVQAEKQSDYSRKPVETGAYFWLTVQPQDEGCKLWMDLTPKRGAAHYELTVNELGRVSALVQEELEHFRYPRAAEQGRAAGPYNKERGCS